MADQQLIEIAKALSIDARVLILDEPTASLSAHEVERLFSIVRQTRDRGVAILFVSHRLEEVFQLCDRATVLRMGATSSLPRLRSSMRQPSFATWSGAPCRCSQEAPPTSGTCSSTFAD